MKMKKSQIIYGLAAGLVTLLLVLMYGTARSSIRIQSFFTEITGIRNINCNTIGERNLKNPKWSLKNNAKTRYTTANINKGNSSFIVPNIVHYIWWADEPKPLRFDNMLSILSAYKYLKPEIIMFHTNTPPVGEYWEQIIKIPVLKIVQHEPTECLFGEPLKAPWFETSSSNVDRLRVLYEYGGIYLDLDVLILKPFDELRRYDCTIGLERDHQACGGIIVCARDALFLTMWINSYLDDYQVRTWAYNTGTVPYKISQRFPHLVHVEKSKLHRPNYNELDMLYGDNLTDLSQNYAVHLWYRVWRTSHFYKEEPNSKNIQNWNSTFAAIARRILSDASELTRKS